MEKLLTDGRTDLLERLHVSAAPTLDEDLPGAPADDKIGFEFEPRPGLAAAAPGQTAGAATKTAAKKAPAKKAAVKTPPRPPRKRPPKTATKTAAKKAVKKAAPKKTAARSRRGLRLRGTARRRATGRFPCWTAGAAAVLLTPNSHARSRPRKT